MTSPWSFFRVGLLPDAPSHSSLAYREGVHDGMRHADKARRLAKRGSLKGTTSAPCRPPQPASSRDGRLPYVSPALIREQATRVDSSRDEVSDEPVAAE
jgi:hypothetical protein